MKILFACFSGLPFDVTTPETAPLGGSESCVAYLATELAKTHDVALLANTTDGVSLRCVRHLLAGARVAAKVGCLPGS